MSDGGHFSEADAADAECPHVAVAPPAAETAVDFSRRELRLFLLLAMTESFAMVVIS
jgi:hypothetical protein